MNMDNVKKYAEKSYSDGLYCAESVVLSITKSQGIESDLLPKIATAFCSGMSRTCGTCGALTGAVLGISAVLGRSGPEESVSDVYDATSTLVDQFEKEFGSKNCHELLGCDLGTPRGQEHFKNNKLSDRCRRYTSKAAELAGNILSHIHEFKIEPFPRLDVIIPLLLECGLPVDDVNEASTTEYFGVREPSKLIGVAGLEVFSNVALLRSVAVVPSHRGKNIGRYLVKYAESKAKSLGIGSVYLLSATAQEYFEELGYVPISRKVAPPEIEKTQQFSTICPSSAVFMRKKLCG